MFKQLRIERHYKQAEDAMANEDFKSARDAYEKVIKINPNDAAALYWAGKISYRIDEPQKAEKFLTQALELSPEAEDVIIALVETYKSWAHKINLHKDGNDSISYLEKALNYAPNDIDLLIHIAVYGKRQNPERSLMYLRRVKELDPKNPRVDNYINELSLADKRLAGIDIINEGDKKRFAKKLEYENQRNIELQLQNNPNIDITRTAYKPISKKKNETELNNSIHSQLKELGFDVDKIYTDSNLTLEERARKKDSIQIESIIKNIQLDKFPFHRFKIELNEINQKENQIIDPESDAA